MDNYIFTDHQKLRKLLSSNTFFRPQKSHPVPLGATEDCDLPLHTTQTGGTFNKPPYSTMGTDKFFEFNQIIHASNFFRLYVALFTIRPP